MSLEMEQWHWQVYEGRPFLTCELLNDWQHGFFTQQWSPDRPGRLVAALNPEVPVYRVKQVHGNQVLCTADVVPIAVDEEEEAEFDPADGLVSTQAQQSVWVCSADCTPALIADASTGQVAAVHAGWRGTAAKIVPVAIAQLQSQGSQIGDLRVALGPAIAGEVYQVAVAVAVQTGRSLIDGADQQEDEQILEALQALPQSPILSDPEPGKVKLDVRRVNGLQLARLGLAAEQVAIAPHCTFQTPDYFFSYRRTQKKQVQWSGIISR